MRAVLRSPPWVRRDWAADAALALAILALELVGCVLSAQQQPLANSLDGVAYTLIVISASSLAFRRRYPALVLLPALLPVMVYYPLGYPEGPVYVAVLVALYSAAAAGRRLSAIAAGVVSLLWTLFGGYLLAPGEQVTLQTLLVACGVGVSVVIGGEVARSRRAYLAEAQERAAQAERMREEEARRSADEERLRIARELHDVLAHNISMMNVQAGVAAHLLDEQPEQARSALLAIKDASKDALRELRATLGTLRQTDEAPAREPTPGLARIDELATQTAAAGLAVDVHSHGDARELPDSVDLAAYRILQEALTNVTRHANADSVTVHVTYGQHELCLQVDDDGTGAPGGPAGGHGIAGMRERAASLGGAVEAGSREAGGFRVAATLPLAPANHAAAGKEAG